MKVLVLTEYPPSAAGLATQGELLCRGLREIGVDVHPVHFESPQEKEWYYRWFQPDVVVGIGFWGHVPHLVLHPQQFGMKGVPWLVADGYVAAHHEVLNALPLILVTSNWVKETYIRDGIRGDNIEVLPVGCDTDRFAPRSRDDLKVRSIREALGVSDDQIMILTVGGDAASKGAQEVMQALALIDAEAPDWRYVCKVWPQPRTVQQNLIDLQLAAHLGIDKKVIYSTNVVSHNFMPYLLAACDIYAAPSRLEGFGMIQVEANACAKPVIAIDAMAFLDTMVHGETAFLAKVAEERKIAEAVFGEGHGIDDSHRIVFPNPRTAEYRASVPDIAKYLLALMQDSGLRRADGRSRPKTRGRVVRLSPGSQAFREDRVRPIGNCSKVAVTYGREIACLHRSGQRGGPPRPAPQRAGAVSRTAPDRRVGIPGALHAGPDDLRPGLSGHRQRGACRRAAAHAGGAGSKSDAARPHPITRARSWRPWRQRYHSAVPLWPGTVQEIGQPAGVP